MYFLLIQATVSTEKHNKRFNISLFCFAVLRSLQYSIFPLKLDRSLLKIQGKETIKNCIQSDKPFLRCSIENKTIKNFKEAFGIFSVLKAIIGGKELCSAGGISEIY